MTTQWHKPRVTFTIGNHEGCYTVVRTERRIIQSFQTIAAAEAEKEACERAAAQVDALEQEPR